jgi:hypothetical protein
MSKLTIGFSKAESSWQWFMSELLKVTLLRVIIVALIVVTTTSWVNARSQKYFSTFTMPPSFRHVDVIHREAFLMEYLRAQNLDENTIIVFGDCVTFGHGVKQSYTEHLQIPGKRVVNVSMQSFQMNLMTIALDYATEQGVTDFVVQLHPFENYRAEQSSWTSTATSYPVSVAENSDDSYDYLQQSIVNWRVQSVAQHRKLYQTGLYLDRAPWIKTSQHIRYDFLSKIKVLATRYAFDDWFGIDKSYYSYRTFRRDNFKKPLSSERQISIIEKKPAFWRYFIVEDKNEFLTEAVHASAPKRLASILNDKGLRAVFMMVQTFTDVMAAHSDLTVEDMQASAEVYGKIVQAENHAYINLLEDPELTAHMYHYDNLTIEGQKLMGEKLSIMLTEEFSR